jgi:hypothetical protein
METTQRPCRQQHGDGGGRQTCVLLRRLTRDPNSEIMKMDGVME